MLTRLVKQTKKIQDLRILLSLKADSTNKLLKFQSKKQSFSSAKLGFYLKC